MVTYNYFNLPIYDGSAVWRERVYCYELYHQMRLLWPEGCECILTGEVNKSAHPLLKKLGAGTKVPDLLIHTPGTMENNLAVFEVKTQDARAEGVEKDFETLRFFREEFGYKRAIHLIFGPKLPYDPQELPPGIELWHHAEVDSPAHKVWPIAT